MCADASAGFGLISRVMSVEEAYTDADSKQITVEGSYMPPVELLKAARTGLSDFASCTCGHMLLTLALSGFKVHRPLRLTC